jgi:hypothetical protein
MERNGLEASYSALNESQHCHNEEHNTSPESRAAAVAFSYWQHFVVHVSLDSQGVRKRAIYCLV